MTTSEETIGVSNMILLENCDDEKMIENLKKRLKKNLIYVSLVLQSFVVVFI